MNFASIAHNTLGERLDSLPVLVKLLDNIIANPETPKYRCINLKNAIVQAKLAQLDGFKALLHSIGYIETDDAPDLLTLPTQIMMAQVKQHVRQLREYLQKIEDEQNVVETLANRNKEEAKRLLSLVVPFAKRTRFDAVLTDNPFIRQMEQQSDQVMQYEDEALQELGRSFIPIQRLTFQASLRLRDIQHSMKSAAAAAEPSSPSNQSDPLFADMLLVQLVDWFKTDFFTWVNVLPCPRCGNANPQPQGSRPHATGYRTELSTCCGQQIQFPRYVDVVQLLRTRRGRCGEYANAFTFLCRCLGYEARLVVATFDHVWTEVWLTSQKRWTHVDPSDGVVDAPLMYQHGWRRSLDYVLAYSARDVQDVTARYCDLPVGELCAKRTRCAETELQTAIVRLQRKRLASCSATQRRHVQRRLLLELADLMTPAKLRNDKERAGRVSGDSMWKVSRGEQRVAEDVAYVFRLTDRELIKKQFNVRFTVARDYYERFFVSGRTMEDLQPTSVWSSCIFEQKNIQRKVEQDWKMAYLCRREGTDEATISWKFDFTGLWIAKINIRCESAEYETGRAKISFYDDKGLQVETLHHLCGKSGFTLKCSLSGGTGDNAFQQAQLFRESIAADLQMPFPFEINVLFVDNAPY